MNTINQDEMSFTRYVIFYSHHILENGTNNVLIHLIVHRVI